MELPWEPNESTMENKVEEEAEKTPEEIKYLIEVILYKRWYSNNLYNHSNTDTIFATDKETQRFKDSVISRNESVPWSGGYYTDSIKVRKLN